MKNLFFVLFLISPILGISQSDLNSNMKPKFIKTSIGEIACYEKKVEGTTPIIFLHGVYYDHNLWNYFTSRIEDRTVLSIDMPLHGNSKNITKKDWNLNDCVTMLEEVLNTLNYEKVYAVGHSWGSMTILRAANQFPERFERIALCNMPLNKSSFGTKFKFGFQHLFIGARGFYTKQVVKAMMHSKIQKERPEAVEYLELSMSKLSNKEVKKTDRAVILKADDAHQYVKELKVPALALKGMDDYVGTPATIETINVEGKHTSPLEQPEKVMELIERLVK